jgi:hypothetical protein
MRPAYQRDTPILDAMVEVENINKSRLNLLGIDFGS